ncbi:Rdx family-domain-containing protein [Amylocarpus encephaloides]|uniref:Rdx family-domain-containing protein n=1 Tax=Amylocarpus encephaloides TaxID=45428 RepID=A0A9P8C971_9HELO|nr:Rdx family-domain-containing protein [Amylocarpus encephaloides]
MSLVNLATNRTTYQHPQHNFHGAPWHDMEPILSPPLPRVEIQFCTQCKWMLRAAYFAQELLSTFSTSLGEVALQPSTGGTFIVNLYHVYPTGNDEPATLQKHLLWDRKEEGGFPETKELKKRVRDVIDPTRNLGHVDGHKKSQSQPEPSQHTLPSTSKNAPTTIALPSNPTSKIATLETHTPSPAPSPISPLDVPIHRGTHPLLSDFHSPTNPITTPTATQPVIATGGEISIGPGPGSGVGGNAGQGERKFNPMDVDVKSRRSSGKGLDAGEGEGTGGQGDGGEGQKEMGRGKGEEEVCEDCM